MFISPRIISLSLIATACLFNSPTALSEESGQPDRGRGHKGKHSFERLDLNQDGLLTLDELLAGSLGKSEKRFHKIDRDGDSQISFEEFTQSRRHQMDLSLIADDIVTCVTELKAETGNTNIKIPSAEHFVSPQDKFNAIDLSGDSFLTLDEVQGAMETKLTRKFKLMDTNDDGQVTMDEYKAYKITVHATKRAVKLCINELLEEEGL